MSTNKETSVSHVSFYIFTKAVHLLHRTLGYPTIKRLGNAAPSDTDKRLEFSVYPPTDIPWN